MNSPFIIFSQSRSGSTLLQKLLDSHSHIHCEGEVLTQTDGYLMSEFGQKTARLFTIPYMYRRKWPVKNKVYGATLFIYHGRYIALNIRGLQRLGWKIIYLERKDIVNQAFSNIIAMRTRHYHNHSETGEKEPQEKHVISEKKFIQVIKNRIRWHAREKKILQGLPFKHVYYERDLMNPEDRNQFLPEIFNYLSVAPEMVDTTLRKTYSRPYSQIVENYDLLLKRLKRDGFTDLYDLHMEYEAKKPDS
jgi:hypothetical protein